jgi:polyphosphate kinase
VVYGIVGLKTHAKMLLVTRREGRQLKRYGHLSTGNYNPRTAKLYTDLSYLTADATLTSDMDQMFLHLASQNHIPKPKKLLPAPFALHKELLHQIRKLSDKATSGKRAHIIAKMNSLTDQALIEALVSAGQAGVQIELIVRGACTLPAGIPKITQNIRVISVIGRFLEHSRVFYFRCEEEQKLLLSSADWMNRNMMRRIELAWPVEDEAIRSRIIHECLSLYLQDQVDAWELKSDGLYQAVRQSAALSASDLTPPRPAARKSRKPQTATPASASPLSAQSQLMLMYGRSA